MGLSYIRYTFLQNRNLLGLQARQAPAITLVINPCSAIGHWEWLAHTPSFHTEMGRTIHLLFLLMTLPPQKWYWVTLGSGSWVTWGRKNHT